jgi:hypothetical protein
MLSTQQITEDIREILRKVELDRDPGFRVVTRFMPYYRYLTVVYGADYQLVRAALLHYWMKRPTSVIRQRADNGCLELTQWDPNV